MGWLRRLGLGWVLGLCLARVRLTCRVLLRRLCRRCAFGLAAPLGIGWVLGLSLALVRLSCRVLLRRLWPPVRVWVGCAAGNWAGCVAFVSRWRVLTALDIAAPINKPPPLRGGCRLNGWGRDGTCTIPNGIADAWLPVHSGAGCAVGMMRGALDTCGYGSQ